MCSQCVFAEGSKYQFELLVFSQNLPTTAVFDQTETKIKWPTALAELSAYQQTEGDLLKQSAAQLFKDAAYQPILQLSWTQTAGMGDVILPVHIQSADGKLDGYVQLRSKPPLELIVDLEQKSGQLDHAGQYYLYHLHEKRAIKANDVNYLDHPKLGVLIAVKPL
jgi:hypothetical protein